jgi:hypothetical protein
MSTEPKGDYAIGYGKPPLATRFKKGQSGNPGGRPRGARSLKTQLYQALDKRVVVTTEGGKRRRIAKRELGIARLVDRFANGDPYATRLVLDQLNEIERRGPLEPAERPPLDEDDRTIIANLLARLRAS